MGAITRRISIGVLTLASVVASVGYGMAFHSRNDCIRDTSQDLAARHVKGFTMEGRTVDAAAIHLASQVSWPFVVDVYYSVPWGMHSAQARNRYAVLPWGTKKVSHESELIL
jgi:hypothetical protein